ncbi:replication factor C small subunit [Candidatus Woesearchaeota archaeon]|nr:replication factor C small subunit [Candidatus Woesearchaeota archaeon]
MDSALWAEKYRPSDFSDIIGQEEIVKRIQAFVKHKNLPHLMFAGPPGVGKTSTALVIAKQLYGENWRQNLIELNASDERGIDVVRTKVKDFARTRALGDVPFKICILDESDSLTREAQQALRRTMENYTATCRFILLANYSSKIIEPIQSRCAVFRFKPLAETEVTKIIDRIAASEKLAVSEKAKKALVEVSEGDCRKLENILQSCAVMSSEITDNLIYEVASVARPKEVKEVISLAFSGNFGKARDKLLETMLAHGLSGLDIIKQLQKEVLESEIDARKKLLLIEKCGEIEFRMSEGADEFVQLEALLSQIALAGQKT